MSDDDDLQDLVPLMPLFHMMWILLYRLPSLGLHLLDSVVRDLPLPLRYLDRDDRLLPHRLRPLKLPLFKVLLRGLF